MSLLPSSPDISPDSEPRVVGLDSEEADDLIAALSSETARRLLAELHEEPMPPGELADAVDTSLQNVQYHLEKLEDAGAIEVAGTAYSEKGREMNVYGPADSPLVIFAGEKERASGLRAAVSRLFGGFLALAAGAIAIQELFGRSLLDTAREDAGGTAPATETPQAGNGDAAGNGNGAAADQSPTPTPDGEDGFDTSDTTGDGATSTAEQTPEPTPEPTPTPDAGATPTPQPEATATPQSTATSTPVEESDDAVGAPEEAADTPVAEATETPTETPVPEPDAATAATETPVPTGDAADPSTVFEGLFGAGLPPGVAFFLGGATVLTVLVAVSYYRSRP